jgi:hypothetical protein
MDAPPAHSRPIGLDDRESQNVEGLVGVPAELGAANAHKKSAVGNLGTRIEVRRRSQTLGLVPCPFPFAFRRGNFSAVF